MKKVRKVQEITYKNHILTKLVDCFGQESVIVDNDFEKEFVSIADAKRVVNGLKPMYEFI